jgi:glycosyltransferase involved in cell wall biosynthesis
MAPPHCGGVPHHGSWTGLGEARAGHGGSTAWVRHSVLATGKSPVESLKSKVAKSLQALNNTNMSPQSELTYQQNEQGIPSRFPLLLSIVITVQDEADQIATWLQRASEHASFLVSDHEIIIVDNGSVDQTLAVLRELASDRGIANLQIFSLAGNVDDLTARWVGVENSLGDLVVCLNWQQDDIYFLEEMLQKASEGYDVVFTKKSLLRSRIKPANVLVYRALGLAIRLSTGMAIDSYSTTFIAVSRRIVSYLLQFPDPQIKFRNLGSSSGFKRTCIHLRPNPDYRPKVKLRQSIPRGIRLLTSSTDSPLRFATGLSALAALFSIFYSIYIFFIWAFKRDVAPGWVSLSMQQSAMFFLMSLVLMIMSEYILEISRKVNSGPPYYIADEFTSTRLTRKERLNIEIEDKENSGNKISKTSNA